MVISDKQMSFRYVLSFVLPKWSMQDLANQCWGYFPMMARRIFTWRWIPISPRMTRRGQLDIPRDATGGRQQQEKLKIGCVHSHWGTWFPCPWGCWKLTWCGPSCSFGMQRFSCGWCSVGGIYRFSLLSQCQQLQIHFRKHLHVHTVYIYIFIFAQPHPGPIPEDPRADVFYQMPNLHELHWGV